MNPNRVSFFFWQAHSVAESSGWQTSRCKWVEYFINESFCVTRWPVDCQLPLMTSRFMAFAALQMTCSPFHWIQLGSLGSGINRIPLVDPSIFVHSSLLAVLNSSIDVYWSANRWFNLSDLLFAALIVDSILENQIIQFKWTVGRIPAWCGIKLPFSRPVKSQLLNQYSIVLEQLLHSYLMARERWSFQPKWPVTYSSVLQIKYASSDWNASACCSSNFLAFDGCPVWPKSSITSFWDITWPEPLISDWLTTSLSVKWPSIGRGRAPYVSTSSTAPSADPSRTVADRWPSTSIRDRPNVGGGPSATSSWWSNLLMI